MLEILIQDIHCLEHQVDFKNDNYFANDFFQ